MRLNVHRVGKGANTVQVDDDETWDAETRCEYEVPLHELGGEQLQSSASTTGRLSWLKAKNGLQTSTTTTGGRKERNEVAGWDRGGRESTLEQRETVTEGDGKRVSGRRERAARETCEIIRKSRAVDGSRRVHPGCGVSTKQ